jgi:hypothetical protein
MRVCFRYILSTALSTPVSLDTTSQDDYQNDDDDDDYYEKKYESQIK